MIKKNISTGNIEIHFKTKPEHSILVGLKCSGFRYNGKMKCWFATNTLQNIETAKFYLREDEVSRNQ